MLMTPYFILYKNHKFPWKQKEPLEAFNKVFMHLNIRLTYNHIAILYFKGNDIIKCKTHYL